jgi:hypothetical protein
MADRGQEDEAMRRSGSIAAFVAGTLLAIAVLAAGAPAQAAGELSVSGTVYLGDRGTPAPAGTATVELVRSADDPTPLPFPPATVDANGAWSISGLSANDRFTIHVSYSGTQEWQTSVYQGPYSPGAGDDVFLLATMKVSGTIRLGDGAPVTAGSVRIDAVWNLANPVSAAPPAFVQSDGTWSMVVQSSDWEYIATWTGADGLYDKAYASPRGYVDTTGVDFTLPVANDIRGQVTAAGSPLAGVTVDAEKVSNLGAISLQSSATTASDGTYDLTGLPDGDYYIYFSTPDYTWADEVWKSTSPYALGSLIHLANTRIDHVDASVQRAGTISGIVNAQGLGSGDFADVTATLLMHRSDGSWFRTADSVPVGADGRFVIPGRYPDSYEVRVAYNGRKGTATTDSATFALAAGGTSVVSVDLPVAFLPSGPPRGSFDEATPGPTSVTVAGWALDPDTSAPVQVHVYVDGQGFAVLTADQARPDIGSAFPGYGSAHGFSANVPGIVPGTHSICTYAIDANAPSTNTQLGCRTVTVLGGDPVGHVDSVQIVPGGVVVRGWAIDPLHDSPVVVHLSGQVINVSDQSWDGNTHADQPRADVGAAYPGYGDAHGFTVTSGHAIWGTRGFSISASALDPIQNGVPSVGRIGFLSGVNTVPYPQYNIPLPSPFGSVDSATSALPNHVTVSGWAMDLDATSTLQVDVYSDGVFQSRVAVAGNRPDVAATYPFGISQLGYSTTLTLGAGDHNICVFGLNQGVGDNTLLGCRTVTVPSGSPIGSIDAIQNAGPGAIQVAGWDLDPDTAASIPTHIYIDGVGTPITASANRTDISAAFPGYGAAHGYTTTINQLSGGTHNVCIFAINAPSTPGDNTLLGCRTVTV